MSRSIKSANIYYFDEEKGYERELKYCQNQKTPFVDEMVGDQRLEHIIFRSGSLYVAKEQTTLQKLLSLYHPHKDTVYDQMLGKNLKRPFLHVRYRASQTDDRKMKTWVTGSVGAATSALDAMQIHMLSERCLVTQGANNFMLMK